MEIIPIFPLILKVGVRVDLAFELPSVWVGTNRPHVPRMGSPKGIVQKGVWQQTATAATGMQVCLAGCIGVEREVLRVPPVRLKWKAGIIQARLELISRLQEAIVVQCTQFRRVPTERQARLPLTAMKAKAIIMRSHQ